MKYLISSLQKHSEKTRKDGRIIRDWRGVRRKDNYLRLVLRKGQWWKNWGKLNTVSSLVNNVVPMLISSF